MHDDVGLQTLQGKRRSQTTANLLFEAVHDPPAPIHVSSALTCCALCAHCKLSRKYFGACSEKDDAMEPDS